MAYRRRQGITRASTFKEEIYHQPPLEGDNDDDEDDDDDDANAPNGDKKKNKKKNNHKRNNTVSSFDNMNININNHFGPPSPSLAAKAIRASAAHRNTNHNLPSSPSSNSPRSKGFNAYDQTDPSRNDTKGFWGVLARKAKAILDEEQLESSGRTRLDNSDGSPRTTQQQSHSQLSPEGFRRMDNPTIRKGLDRITTSLNQIGDHFEKAFEEGKTMVENKTADIKLQIRRKGNEFDEHDESPRVSSQWQQSTQSQNQTNHETQLKASRDVAMATAAKAKLLLRELKTVKADLAFAKERCAQLEEENKSLREREKGGNGADDDLIRLQLETLLAEKGRLANENSIYARENRFLREIVEYHQLTMQDVVYLDENSEEVTEVYPLMRGVSRTLSITPPSPTSPPSPRENNYPQLEKRRSGVPTIIEVEEEEEHISVKGTGCLEHKEDNKEKFSK
ncbi:hypothetical protein ACFE04_001773 [Oxalis oulophora]